MNNQQQPTRDAEDVTVGENIQAIRKRRGMSQTALADAMRRRGHDHWRQNTVSRVETGKQSLRMTEAEALEELLGGGIWEGTRAARAGAEIAKVAERRYLLGKLCGLDDVLSAALDDVRRLRLIIDRDFAVSDEELDRLEESDEGV